MRSDYIQSGIGSRLATLQVPRKTMVGVILMIALLAFEMFNFDTSQYALRNLLGDVTFLQLQWASILAIAFCSIDFAGLIRLFTPEQGSDEPKEVWYLMGAWLLGATMNAVLTWWAVSLTLLNHDFGNEVLSRDQLLRYVPIFVAVLVWLTRILFIGAFTVAGEHIFDFSDENVQARPQPAKAARRQPTAPPRRTPVTTPRRVNPAPKPTPVAAAAHEEQPTQVNPRPAYVRSGTSNGRSSRVQQRPPMPNGRRVPGYQTKGRNN